MKEQIGITLPELYRPVWDLKRKSEWVDRVQENLNSVVPLVPRIVDACDCEFGCDSVQSAAMRASVRFLEPMTEIFIQQLRMPSLSECSWVDIAPEASGRLLTAYDDMLASSEYKRLVAISPLYETIFSSLPLWATLGNRTTGHRLSAKLAASAAHLSRQELPVVLISQGEVYTKHVDPDLRLIFPHIDPSFRMRERELQAGVWGLSGRKHGFVYRPAIVGDLRFAAGSQWASLTVGEQLSRTAMLCPNVYKTLGTVQEVFETSGLPYDVGFVKDRLTEVYCAHEFAHDVFKNGPEIQIEMRADLPSIAETFLMWSRVYDSPTLINAVQVVNGEYLHALRDGLYGETLWDAYYYSAASYFEDMIHSGCLTVGNVGELCIDTTRIILASELLVKRLKKGTMAYSPPNQLTTLISPLQ